MNTPREHQDVLRSADNRFQWVLWLALCSAIVVPSAACLVSSSVRSTVRGALIQLGVVKDEKLIVPIQQPKSFKLESENATSQIDDFDLPLTIEKGEQKEVFIPAQDIEEIQKKLPKEVTVSVLGGDVQVRFLSQVDELNAFVRSQYDPTQCGLKAPRMEAPVYSLDGIPVQGTSRHDFTPPFGGK